MKKWMTVKRTQNPNCVYLSVSSSKLQFWKGKICVAYAVSTFIYSLQHLMFNILGNILVNSAI